MGHRALIAYQRDDDDGDATADPSYDLHRSHWGAADFALRDHLSTESPYATDTPFAVDPDPLATDLSLDRILTDHLDFLHHEAFYRVSPDYATTAFHVLWFGLEADGETVERSETVGHGALVEALPEDGSGADSYLQGWLRGTKAVVGDLLDRGDLNRAEAVDYLAERVESWAADREVLFPD